MEQVRARGEVPPIILDGYRLSQAEVAQVMRTGEIVTQNGYRLFWSESRGLAVQLPLVFPVTGERTV